MDSHDSSSTGLRSPWTSEQREWLGSQLGLVTPVADLSWDLQGLTVMHARTSDGTDVVIKHGCDAQSREKVHPHMTREIRAYENWVKDSVHSAPKLIASNAGLGMLVLEFLEGQIALGTHWEDDPEIWEQAGTATRAFNSEPQARNSSFDGGNLQRVRERIKELAAPGFTFLHADDEQGVLAVIRAAGPFLESHKPVQLDLVPTHADNSPRNWLVSPEGQVRLIDFGRAGVRPFFTELDHVLHAPPHLQNAFARGYGRPLNPRSWNSELQSSFVLHTLNGFFGGILWARQYGDAAFEREICARASWILEFLKHTG